MRCWVATLILMTCLILGISHAVFARCDGGLCSTCTNCSRCYHCNRDGGTCSVCAGSGSTAGTGSSSYSGSSSENYHSSDSYPTASNPPRTYVSPPAPSTVVRRRVVRKTVVQSVPPDTPPCCDFSGKVVGVSDGDTISVLYTDPILKTKQPRAVSVRLYGIDCPEKAQPFGTQAKKFTSDKVFGKPATIYVKGVDQYNRTLGWAFVSKQCVNRDLVKNGYAWWYSKYAPAEKKLEDLETQAREKKIGLWSDVRAVAPWDWRRGQRTPSQPVNLSPPSPPTRVVPTSLQASTPVENSTNEAKISLLPFVGALGAIGAAMVGLALTMQRKRG